VNLSATGEFSMLQSIDGQEWAEVPYSTVVCAPIGLQTFVECQYELLYKIQTNKEVINAKVVI